LRPRPEDLKIQSYVNGKTRQARGISNSSFYRRYILVALWLTVAIAESFVLLSLWQPMSFQQRVIVVIGIDFISSVLALIRPSLVVRLSVRVIHGINRAGNWILRLSAVSILATVVASRIAASQYNDIFAPLYFVLATAFLLGIVITLYFDVFHASRFSALCFRQAVESKGRAQYEWIRRGLQRLNESFAEYRLDIDSGRLERHFALRMVDGESVDADINRLALSLESGGIVEAVGQLLGDRSLEFIRMRRRWADRIRLPIEDWLRVVQILSICVFLIVLILDALGLIHLTMPAGAFGQV
jgi:hypothetical protein